VTQDQLPAAQIDTSVASSRAYDYWLGGRTTSRPTARLPTDDPAVPDIVAGVRRTVPSSAARSTTRLPGGIRQFLDIGTGLPSSNNTHEVAAPRPTPASST
jgi:hypothetical protein